MYKIRQVAEILNVPTVRIHEKLILLRQDLKECIHKKNSITYIDDKGLVIIKKAFESEMHEHLLDQEPSVDLVHESEEYEDVTGSSKLTDIESSYDMKVIELKEKIGHSKSAINKLDIELKRIDEAIIHYQQLLKDDIDWRIAAEEKLETKSDESLSEEPIESEPTEKKGFFNSFINK